MLFYYSELGTLNILTEAAGFFVVALRMGRSDFGANFGQNAKIFAFIEMICLSNIACYESLLWVKFIPMEAASSSEGVRVFRFVFSI